MNSAPAIALSVIFIVSSILVSSVPLLLSSFGALVSDSAGRLAIFMDGMINLAAFFCFALTIKTASLAAGCALSVLLCAVLVSICAIIIEIAHADPFLMSLSLNITSGALSSYLSKAMFGTRGVLTSAAFNIDPQKARLYTTIAAYALLTAATAAFMTKRGALYIRLCSSDSALLKERGVPIRRYTSAAYLVSGIFAALAGCTLALRLSSFVPSVSSGTGWLACAVVYIGRSISHPFVKGRSGTEWATCIAVFLSSITVSAVSFMASRVQNICPAVMPTLLLAMPYIASIVLLAIIGQHHRSL